MIETKEGRRVTALVFLGFRRAWEGGRVRRRVPAERRICCKRMCMGGRERSFFVRWVGVVWKMPAILQQVSFWAICRERMGIVCLVSVNQTGAPYSKTGRITAL